MREKLLIAAARAFIAGDCAKEAIDAFVAAHEWAKAKKVAAELEPGSVSLYVVVVVVQQQQQQPGSVSLYVSPFYFSLVAR